MSKSIELKNNDVVYLCIWNNGDIKQIHTKKTLLNEYKNTNLFDNDCLFETIGNGFDNLTINEYLTFSKKDNDFINLLFSYDNMSITRII